jgi:soluble lytic murein transglycosylase-like protein
MGRIGEETDDFRLVIHDAQSLSPERAASHAVPWQEAAMSARAAWLWIVVALMGQPVAASNFDWFWTEAAAPTRSAARPARMAGLGEAVLRRHPDLRRLGPAAGRVLRQHGAALHAAAAAGRISPPLLLALVVVESGGDPRAVSPRGAMGLGQLMPGTAERVGVADPFDPTANLRGAAAYLDRLLRQFDDDAVLALAAYNAGDGAVIRRSAVPPFAETRAYVPRVLAEWAVLRRACPRLPSHPRHPCRLPH